MFFDSEDHTLFGIITIPLREVRNIGVILVRGGGPGPSSGRNRTAVRLCRRLAVDGFHTLRFDYHGVGDSTGKVHRFRHDEPFVADVEAASMMFRENGIDRIALVGECFGSRTALACGQLQGLQALVLLAAPVRDSEKDSDGPRALVRHRSMLGYARQALRPSVIHKVITNPPKRRRFFRAARAVLKAKPTQAAPTGKPAVPAWVSRRFLSDLEDVVQRHIPIGFIRGTGDPSFEDFERARTGTMGEIARRGGDQITLETIEGRIGACADGSLQEVTIGAVADWLVALSTDQTPLPHASMNSQPVEALVPTSERVS